MGRAEPIILRVASKTNMIARPPIIKSSVVGRPERITIAL